MPDDVVPGRKAAASALFPAREERERCEDRLTQTLLAAAARASAGSVTPTFDLAAFRNELARFDFAAALPLDVPLSWVVAQLEHGVTHFTTLAISAYSTRRQPFPPNAPTGLLPRSTRSWRR
jgi:hypothetical protein